ncbi:cysteine desulfurase [Alkalicaulis satelles]|uniref:Cysteine desulfurase n=1 Tax=Alkalicaulis satelles TaxID=2609175 RepID=A0A5M6ZL87_9PROT|nr:cysteine desulfurase family protein [Alkalicaulis satelles]KAA5804447.1 cysteine desulfurase [Alkalicaulis satelles]
MSVYLDHNASAPLRPEARAAITAALDACGNPSSVHRDGRAARARLETARGAIARAMTARAEDVIFTSGGTEANNLAIAAAKAAGAQRIIHAAFEHDAVIAPAAASDLPVEIWPVRSTGVADLDWLEDRLARGGDERLLIVLMAANNETGVIQPVAEAGRMAREAGHYFHVDAVQIAGKAPFDFAGSLAHFAALSAHKCGGPMGVGALIAACDAGVNAQIRGGGQESFRRAGTQNLPGIAGFAAALDAALADRDEPARIAAIRDAMEARLLEAGANVTVWGADAPRLPGTSCLSAPGWLSEIQVIALDLAGFAVSAGAACSSGKVRRSKVLDAMGAGAEHAQCALRVSYGWSSTMDEAEAFASAWIAAHAKASSAPALRAAI